MNIKFPHATCARTTDRAIGGRVAPFLLGVALSALIWTTLAVGTMVSVTSVPLNQQPMLALTK